MKDNEIIKALELCFAPDPKACSKCPYNEFGKLCKTKRNRDALDLIKRQKTEIEVYQKHIDNDIIYANAIKAEAIKDFAERLKERTISYVGVVEQQEAIDNLAKEMTGEQQ